MQHASAPDLREELGGTRPGLPLDVILDCVYQAALAWQHGQIPVLYSKFLMICHKSMLAAAVIIGEDQPEDSYAITRRAVECAQVALASKIEPNSLKTWLSQESRMPDGMRGTPEKCRDRLKSASL